VALALQVLVAPDSATPTLGASGAIAAVLGAYIVLHPRARIRTLVVAIFRFTIVELAAWMVVVAWFVIDAVLRAVGLSTAFGVSAGASLLRALGRLRVRRARRARAPRTRPGAKGRRSARRLIGRTRQWTQPRWGSARADMIVQSAEWGAVVKGSSSGPAAGRPEGVPFTTGHRGATPAIDPRRRHGSATGRECAPAAGAGSDTGRSSRSREACQCCSSKRRLSALRGKAARRDGRRMDAEALQAAGGNRLG
jgi:hypothetical protein